MALSSCGCWLFFTVLFSAVFVQARKRFERTLFIRIRPNQQIWGVIPVVFVEDWFGLASLRTGCLYVSCNMHTPSAVLSVRLSVL